MTSKRRIMLVLSWWLAFPFGCGFLVLAFQIIGHLGESGVIQVVRPISLVVACSLFFVTASGTLSALLRKSKLRARGLLARFEDV